MKHKHNRQKEKEIKNNIILTSLFCKTFIKENLHTNKCIHKKFLKIFIGNSNTSQEILHNNT